MVAPLALPGLEVAGIDMHIGSQITDLEPFDAAFGRLGELVASLRAAGHTIRHVDLGGGLGIPYRRPTIRRRRIRLLMSKWCASTPAHSIARC